MSAHSTQFGTKHWAAIAVLAIAGCVGTIGDEGAPDAVAGAPGPGPGPGPGAAGDGGSSVLNTCKPSASLAHARLSLITDDQYRNIVRDVLGVQQSASKKRASTGVWS